MISITRMTDGSYAPFPLIVETDEGAFHLSVPGPMSRQSIPGRRVYHIEGPIDMYQFAITTCDGELHNLHDVYRLSDLGHVSTISVTDGFLWDTDPLPPSVTYRGVSLNNGYPELNGMYYVGW